MKTFARYAWPVPLTAAIEYFILNWAHTHLGPLVLRPIHRWSIAGSLLLVAGMQWLAFHQDRKHKLYLEQQRQRLQKECS